MNYANIRESPKPSAGATAAKMNFPSPQSSPLSKTYLRKSKAQPKMIVRLACLCLPYCTGKPGVFLALIKCWASAKLSISSRVSKYLRLTADHSQCRGGKWRCDIFGRKQPCKSLEVRAWTFVPCPDHTLGPHGHLVTIFSARPGVYFLFLSVSWASTAISIRSLQNAHFDDVST